MTKRKIAPSLPKQENFIFYIILGITHIKILQKIYSINLDLILNLNFLY